MLVKSRKKKRKGLIQRVTLDDITSLKHVTVRFFFFLKGLCVKCLFQSTSLTWSGEKKKTNGEKWQTNKKFKASKNILESSLRSVVAPLLWMMSWRAAVHPSCQQGGPAPRRDLCDFVSCNGCRRSGLLLGGGGRCGCALRLDDLVGDQVFWVGLQTHSSRTVARCHVSTATRRQKGKHQNLAGPTILLGFSLFFTF